MAFVKLVTWHENVRRQNPLHCGVNASADVLHAFLVLLAGYVVAAMEGVTAAVLAAVTFPDTWKICGLVIVSAWPIDAPPVRRNAPEEEDVESTVPLSAMFPVLSIEAARLPPPYTFHAHVESFVGRLVQRAPASMPRE